MNETGIKTEELIKLVDHTRLKSFETDRSIKGLIDEASSLGTYSVCIEPNYLEFARNYIDSKHYNLKIAVVVDFPFGSGTTETRSLMMEKLSTMAEELDIVAPMGYVKSGRFDLVENDLKLVVGTAHLNHSLVKVIVEDAYTTLNEKKRLYELVMTSGADFIKTGTGFEDEKYAASIGNKTGAQVENVKLMAELSRKFNPNIGIKAAGGIHTYSDAISLLRASGRNADPLKFRIGASGTRKIMETAPS
jgi:deoxyribose-phosphate aldolase